MTNTKHKTKQLLYDGSCNLCTLSSSLVKKTSTTIERIDVHSPHGKKLAQKYNLDTHGTVHLIDDVGIHKKSNAIIATLKEMGMFGKILASIFSYIPETVRNFIYDCIARHRHLFNRK